MSDSNARPWNTKDWTLQQAAYWIESKTDVKGQTSSEISVTSVEELHKALKDGEIIGSGCVDGGERRAISREEWHDYFIKLRYAMFLGVGFMSSRGTAVIDVLSVRPFPAGALKYHAYPSGVRIPSSHSSDGEVGYHRAITDVLLSRNQITQLWPSGRQALLKTESAVQPDSGDRRGARSKPDRERARRAIDDVYASGVPDQADEPNVALYRKVGQWLKNKGLPDVSNDTILRLLGAVDSKRK